VARENSSGNDRHHAHSDFNIRESYGIASEVTVPLTKVQKDSLKSINELDS
jgi:hypothetical protein